MECDFKKVIHETNQLTEPLISFAGNIIFNSLIPNHFFGEEGLSQLFCFTISGYCKEVNLILDTFLHQAVAVKISDKQQQRLFHGMVSEVMDLGVTGHKFRRFLIRLQPQLWFLSLTKASQLFQQQTVPEILHDIFQTQQIFAVDMQSLTQNYVPKSYCAQYNESYLVFIFRVMEEVGIQYYFTFSDKQHTLHLIDDLNLLPQLAQALNYNSIQQDGTYIHEWQQEFSITSNQFGLNDYNYETPNLNLTTQLKAMNVIKVTGVSSEIEKYEYPGYYQNITAGQQKVSLALQRVISHQELISGTSNELSFQGGLRFQFNDAKTDLSQTGQYFLIKVSHECLDASDVNIPLTEQPWKTTLTMQSYKNEFSACSNLLHYSPPQRYKKPVIAGYHNAIVIGTEGKSIDTDKLGRIKVKFPWDSSEHSSSWIRVMQQQTGSGWGIHFLPRVGDEVLIQYIDGDIDQPICIGTHYNISRKPLYPLPEYRHISGIRTSSVGSCNLSRGHEVQFNDLPGKEFLQLKAENQFTEIIKQDANQRIGNSETITIGGNHLTQTDECILFQCSKSIYFFAPGGSIEVTADSILIKGQQIDIGNP